MIRIELVDLFDENRVPLGRVHDRDMDLPEGAYIVAVGIWIMNGRGQLLLTKRDPRKGFAPNCWENTGGHVQAGEDSRSAAARELQEETGIIAKPDELRYLGYAKVPPYFGDNFALLRDIPASAVQLREGETVDAQWVAYEDFLRMGAAGQLAGSVLEHLSQYQDEFLSVLYDSGYGAATRNDDA